MLVVAVGAHFVALYFGVYDAQIANGFVWFDNLLHAVVGVAFGLLWLWWLGSAEPNLWGMVAFVLVAALLWELLEYGFFIFFNTYALGLKVYSPTWAEALSDAGSNVFGALMLAGWRQATK